MTIREEWIEREKEGRPFEEWRPTAEFSGHYEVSNLGGFRSARGLLKPRPNPDGYLIVTISYKGVRYTRKLHRLVCAAFNGSPNALHKEAAHLDGDRANARADNLKWVSRTENLSHRILHGTHPAGEAHPLAKLTDESVREILQARAEGADIKPLAEKYGVRPSTVESIFRRKNWRHIKGPEAAYLPSHFGQDGERNHWAKLTNEQAARMRSRKAAGERVDDLAKEFGVSRSSAFKAIAGQSYRAAGEVAR